MKKWMNEWINEWMSKLDVTFFFAHTFKLTKGRFEGWNVTHYIGTRIRNWNQAVWIKRLMSKAQHTIVGSIWGAGGGLVQRSPNPFSKTKLTQHPSNLDSSKWGVSGPHIFLLNRTPPFISGSAPAYCLDKYVLAIFLTRKHK